jgi:hypothetical protein
MLSGWFFQGVVGTHLKLFFMLLAWLASKMSLLLVLPGPVLMELLLTLFPSLPA